MSYHIDMSHQDQSIYLSIYLIGDQVQLSKKILNISADTSHVYWLLSTSTFVSPLSAEQCDGPDEHDL